MPVVCRRNPCGSAQALSNRRILDSWTAPHAARRGVPQEQPGSTPFRSTTPIRDPQAPLRGARPRVARVWSSPTRRELQLFPRAPLYPLEARLLPEAANNAARTVALNARVPDAPFEAPGSTCDLISLGQVGHTSIEIDAKRSFLADHNRQKTSVLEAKDAPRRPPLEYSADLGRSTLPRASEPVRQRVVFET